MLAHAEDLPAKQARVEVPGLKVEVTKDESWETVGMILVLVLGVYAGIKFINRLFENKPKIKNKNSIF
jgi:hypothetical protein